MMGIMLPKLHRDKAERIEHSLNKCSMTNYEALIEGAMLAGTHWFNYAVHIYGIAEPSEDTMHAEYLTGARRLKVSLIAPQMLAALDEIESMRPHFVRGDVAGCEKVGHRALELLNIISTAALSARPYQLQEQPLPPAQEPSLYTAHDPS